jgi:hypothetical protein
VHTGENVYSPAARALDKTSAKEIQMRRLAFVPIAVLVTVLAAACSEAPRRTFRVSLDGQSPPEPPKPTGPAAPPEPPAPDTAAASSPAWLRSASPISWTSPPGWEEIQSTKPQRLVEFTIEKNGPGGAPVQFLILNGMDDHPTAKQVNLTRWETFFHEDQALQQTTSEHDGLRVTRFRVHGEFDGQPSLGNSEAVKEPNWTMIAGWVEGPSGSIMFRVQGPDAIINANLTKIDQLLASMKPNEKKP